MTTYAVIETLGREINEIGGGLRGVNAIENYPDLDVAEHDFASPLAILTDRYIGGLCRGAGAERHITKDCERGERYCCECGTNRDPLVLAQSALFGCLEDLTGLEDAKLFTLGAIVTGHRDSLRRISTKHPHPRWHAGWP